MSDFHQPWHSSGAVTLDEQMAASGVGERDTEWLELALLPNCSTGQE
jgi:hypothetical protein